MSVVERRLRAGRAPAGTELASSGSRASPAPVREVKLIGGFELRIGGRAVGLAQSAARLLAFLSLRGRRLQRSFVASTLWIDAPEERAAARLRTTLWRIAGTSPWLVEVESGHLALAEGVSVDLRNVEEHARRLRQECLPIGAGDLEALQGDILPDWYEDWVVIERERFRQRRLHALEAVCERLSADSRFAEAVEAGLAAVSAEPLRESAHRALIRAHLAEGNRSEAIRSYRIYRQLLREELGIEPSDRMKELVGD